MRHAALIALAQLFIRFRRDAPSLGHSAVRWLIWLISGLKQRNKQLWHFLAGSLTSPSSQPFCCSQPLSLCGHLCSPLMWLIFPFNSGRRLRRNWVITNTKAWAPARCRQCTLTTVGPRCRGRHWNVPSERSFVRAVSRNISFYCMSHTVRQIKSAMALQCLQFWPKITQKDVN